MSRRRQERYLPDDDQLRAYLDEVGEECDVRDAARYFGVRSKDRPALRGMLRRLRGKGNDGAKQAELPPIAVLDVERLDDEGEGIAVLAKPARAFRVQSERGARAPTPGDRILARLDPEAGTASVIRILPARQKVVVGLVRQENGKQLIESLERGAKAVFEILGHQAVAFAPGDMVRAMPADTRHFGPPLVRVVANLGRIDAPRTIGRAISQRLDIPIEFSGEAEAQAAAARPVRTGKRRDLRDLPLVTIDGADARDFDDAVFAEPHGAGHRIIVAIADVAHYVRSGDALDREAQKRGNSVYFPDHAIAMLPPALSSDLCSLKPRVNRACLAVDLTVGSAGELQSFNFSRAIMRSAARLTYEQMQAALDGRPDELTGPLVDPHLNNLQAAYRSLLKARECRGTLDLDLPERQILFDALGRPVDIGRRQRLDSHKLIEEMMILANVAAARALDGREIPYLFRVHDRPEAVRLEALADYLKGIGVPFRKTAGGARDFSDLIGRVDDQPVREIVSQLILRCQAQAVYQPENIGHFGLNLRHYAHFTSPIRRYSDLLLHRALIRAFGLGTGGLPKEVTYDEMARLGAHLSVTERRAMDAERRTMERMIALVMEGRVGNRFAGRITSVQRFGLFVALDDSGAEGLVPVSLLGGDRFFCDERFQALIGERYGDVYATGDRLSLELIDVRPASGSLVFKIIKRTPGPTAAFAAKALDRLGKRARGGERKHQRRGQGNAARPKHKHW